MLIELAVTDLGVIADLRLLLRPGMTALTGETGAGKTLVVTAIDLLLGGRADGAVVRPGAAEARVEGRFADDDGEEVVLARVVPADGRSRAYVDGSMATVGALAEVGRRLVDVHGQHAHQSLLGTPAQRAALDRFGRVDLGPLRAAQARQAEAEAELAALGGDERVRAREIDLLRHQLSEIDAAAITGPDEDAALEAEEALLADADAHRQAAGSARASLVDDGAALDALGSAIAAVSERPPFSAIEQRLRGVAAELADAASDLRAAGEAIADDPHRLASVRGRRQLLQDLRRKYGATLAEVLDFAVGARSRLAELESHEQRAAEVEASLADARRAVAAAARTVAAGRRAAAPVLAASVESILHRLAMPRASVGITVDGDDPGDDVNLLLAANPGEPGLPLAKVASGGELARVMLALRLALLDAAGAVDGRTLVFDEVDAGVGGEAALAVGRSLAALAAQSQVLVVTHLPQVAAFADHQIAVRKSETDGRSVASAGEVDGGDRVVELSRMLSGSPGSDTARDHAEELLLAAAEERGR